MSALTSRTLLELSNALATSTLLSNCATSLPSVSRRCQDPRLELPVPPEICPLLLRAGASTDTARQLSEMFASSVASLECVTRDSYRETLHDLRDSHDFCDGDEPDRPVCAISQGVRHALLRIHERKLQEMSAELVQLVYDNRHRDEGNKPTSLIVDHLPILEFAFGQSPKPTAQDKTLLSQATGLTIKQINIWFQNRRARQKAGHFQKRAPPQTIAELKEQLVVKPVTALPHPKHDESSGSEAHDSGYASAPSRSNSMPSVDDLARLLEDFHISDDASPVITKPQKRQQKTRSKPTPRRVSTSSDDSLAERPVAGRPDARKSRPRPAASRAAGNAPRHSVSSMLVPDARASRTLAVSVADPLACAVSAAFCKDQSSTVSDAASSIVAEVSSANAIRRRRKPAPLPARRPRQPATSSQSVSSSSSSESVFASSRDVSSASSQSSNTGSESLSAATTNTKQLYYRDAVSGEFVPVLGCNVVESPTSMEPVVHESPREVVLPAHDDVVIGSPNQLLFAPDDNPRAFSSNLLQHQLAAPDEQVARPPVPLFDFSCTLPGLQGVPTGAANGGEVATPSVPAPLEQLSGDAPRRPWAHPVVLDVVSHTYDLSWTATGAHAENWAHLFGIEI